jgi:hypothetical protein
VRRLLVQQKEVEKRRMYHQHANNRQYQIRNAVVADVRVNAGVARLPQPHYTDGDEGEHDSGAQRPSDFAAKLRVVQRSRVKLVCGIPLLEILPHKPKYAAADAEVSE